MEQSNNTSNTSSASRKSPEDTFRTDLGKTVLPLVEEYVVISKEIIETGKVFIRKRVHEEEASVNIPIIQEGYEMKRLPGSKTLLKEYPSIRYEGDNMIIPVVKEVLVIEKRYEVIEEVHLTKTKTQIPYLQQITLLKETVEVERKKTDS